MKPLLEDAARRAAEYLASLPERPVAPTAEAVRRLSALDVPLQDEARDPQQRARRARRARDAGDDGDGRAALLRLRDRRVAAGGARGELARRRVGSERRHLLRHARGRAPRSRSCSAGSTTCSACRPEPRALSSTGATMANFTSLAAARHAVLERAGWNVEADGLFGAPPGDRDRRRGSAHHAC